MEVLLLLLLISAPFFYIRGLIAAFGGEKKTNPSTAAEIADSLRVVLEKTEVAQSKKKLQKALALIEGVAASEGSLSAVGDLTEVGEDLKNVQDVRQAIREATPIPDNSSVSEVDMPRVDMDKSNVLLFLGAFLLVIAVGIFIGFSYQSFSDVVKTLLVVSVAFAFYASGLTIYIRSMLLRPAGATFTFIGLILVPICGLAMYLYIFQQSQIELTWLITSVIAVGCYWLAYLVMQRKELAYLTVLTIVSLALSFVSLVTTSLFALCWAAAFISSVLFFARLRVGTVSMFFEPLQLIGHGLVMAALLFSFSLILHEGVGQLTIQLALTAVYWTVLALISPSSGERTIAMWTTTTLLPAACISAVFIPNQPFPYSQAGWIIFLFAIGYFVLHEILDALGKRLASYQQSLTKLKLILQAMTVCGLMIAPWLVFTMRPAVSVMVCAALLMTVWWYVRTKQLVMYLLAVLCVFFLPLTLFQTNDFTGLLRMLTGGYVIVGLVFHLARWVFVEVTELTKVALIIAFALSVAGAILLGVGWISVLFLCTVCVQMGVIAYAERERGMVFCIAVLSMLIAYHLRILLNVESIQYPFILLCLGMFWQIMARYHQDVVMQGALKSCALLTLAAGVLARILFPDPSVWPIVCFLTANSVIYSCGYILDLQRRRKVCAAALIVGVQWLLWDVFAIREQLFYTMPWAAYLYTLSQLELSDQSKVLSHRVSQSQGWLVMSLGLLTFPLLWQGLNDPSRGLLLMAIDVALILFGRSRKVLLSQWWGTVLLVLQALYYFRDFLLGIPTWVYFGTVGCVFLAVSIWMLSKKKE